MNLHWNAAFLSLLLTKLLTKAAALTSAAQRLRSLYSGNGTGSAGKLETAIVLPGCHDALSAKIYANAGAKALFLSGFGVSACKIGQPDVGVLTLTEMENALRSVVQASRGVPVIVDGDTGFGGSVNVRRTVRAFAAIGAAAVTIEDQEFPKKCTYAAGKGVKVVSREDSSVRIQAALAARDEARDIDGNEILVIARTDCRASLGFNEALERCKMYEKLGADICYAENLQTREEYINLREAIKPTTATLLAQVQTGDEHQILYSAQDIGEMNYNFALFGVTALQAYARSVEMSARIMMAPDSSGLVEMDSDLHLSSFTDLKSAIGFEESEEFAAKFDSS